MLAIICLPTILLGACDNKNENIDLSVYFENKVTYQVHGKSGNNEVTLNDFTHNDHENQLKYMNITFTGKPAWLYQMNIEKITFEVFSNVDLDVQMEIKVSNVKDGDISNTSSTNTVTKLAPVSMKKNKTVQVTVEIGKTIESISASTTIKIGFADSTNYSGDNKDLDFKFDLSNFKVYGKH